MNILSSEKKKLDLIQAHSSDFFVHRLSEADFTSISLESHALTVFYACGIHDFRKQEKGFDNAERYSSVFIAPNGDFVETSIELYVKSIGANEPLMKIGGLAEQCDPGNLIVMVWSEARQELGIICINTATERTLPNLLDQFLQFRDSGPIETTPPARETPKDEAAHTPVGKPTQPENSLDETSLLFEIWGRGSGGGLAAESPKGTFLAQEMRGPWASGLELAAKLFAEAVNSKDPSQPPVSLFLVGGPGAGKSSFAKFILSELDINLADYEMANLRALDFQGPSSFRLVNDATIKNSSADESLKLDIAWSEENQQSLFVCANRGVIADESNLENLDLNSAHREVLNWLSQYQADSFENLAPVPGGSDYFQIANQTLLDGSKRQLVAVYLDVGSLLEPLPTVTLRPDGLLDAPSQALSSVGDTGNGNRAHSPLGELLSQVASRLAAVDFEGKFGIGADSPLTYNCKLLGTPEFQTAFLKGLRVGEIISETKVTYRLFWASLSKVIFGPLREQTDFENLFDLAARFGPDSAKTADLNTFFGRSSYYAPLNLFTQPTSYADSPTFPKDRASEFWKRLDPVLRSSADRLKLDGLFSEDSQIDLVMDAMKSVEPDQSAIQILDKTSSYLHAIGWPEYLTHLDELHAVPTDELTDSQRGAATSNYGRILVRYCAFFSGEFSCIEEAEVWISLAQSVPVITSEEDLLVRFTSLIKPRVEHSDSGSPSLMPYLDSHLTPLRGLENNEPRLAVSLENVQIGTIQIGPALYLDLKELGMPIGQIRCDFSLIREALSSSPSSLGVTDQSGFVDPRLDRVRATKLASEGMRISPRVLLVKGSSTVELKVESASYE